MKKDCPVCGSKLRREGKFWVCVCGFYQLVRPPKKWGHRTAHDVRKQAEERE